MSPFKPVSRAVRAAVAALIAAAVLVLGTLPGAPVASAAVGERSGGLVVVDESGSALTAGGSATVFGLKLPAGAACPGDSATDGYRVEGFLIPSEVDPGSVVYGELAPDVEGGWGLWDTNTMSFDGGFTSDAPPGEPGLIVNLPNFSFGVLYPGELPAGEYRIGIACSLMNETTRYWDAPFSIAVDESDEPAAFRWSAPVSGDLDAAGSSSNSTAAGVIAGTVVLLVLLVVLGVAIARRRSHNSQTSQSKERSS